MRSFATLPCDGIHSHDVESRWHFLSESCNRFDGSITCRRPKNALINAPVWIEELFGRRVEV